MTTNEMICNCKQVSYGDVEDALRQLGKFDDVLKTFDEVQKLPIVPQAVADVMIKFCMLFLTL